MKELLYLKDEQIKEFIEKLFLSYRDTFSDSKAVLNKYSLAPILKIKLGFVYSKFDIRILFEFITPIIFFFY